MIELWYKQIKDKKFKKSSLSVKPEALDTLKKEVGSYKDQFAKDIQVNPNTIEVLLVNKDAKKVVWFDIGHSDKQLKSNPDLMDKFKKEVESSGLSLVVNENFSFLKDLLVKDEEIKVQTAVEKIQESLVVEENKISGDVLKLTMELIFNSVREGNTVRVLEGNGFDSGRMGNVVSVSGGTATVLDSKTNTTFSINKKHLERLVNENDMRSNNLSSFFGSLNKSIISKLVESGVPSDYASELVGKNDRIKSRLSIFMEGNTFHALKDDQFVESVVEALNFEFPLMKTGKLVKEVKEYQFIKPLKEGSNDLKKGDFVKVDMKAVKKFDSMPAYIKLVNKVVKDGEGKVMVASVNTDGTVNVRSSEYDILGDVRVPTDALTKV